MHKSFSYIATIPLMAACGGPTWPAYVKQMEGFADAQTIAVKAAISDLNANAHTILVDLEGEGRGFAISFSLTNPPLEDGDELGHATWTKFHCEIEMHPQAFGEGPLETVVWHELGHCPGLQHVADLKAIMYPIVVSFSTYQHGKLFNFIGSLETSAGFGANPYNRLSRGGQEDESAN